MHNPLPPPADYEGDPISNRALVLFGMICVTVFLLPTIIVLAAIIL